VRAPHSTRRAFVVLLCAALALGIVCDAASARHPRPKAAGPLHEPLVIAYKSCAPGAGSHFHKAPYSFAACSPPQQVTPWLTTCEPMTWGCAADFTGLARLDACTTTAGICAGSIPPDIKINFSAVGVRCSPALITAGGPCGPQTPLALYGGMLDAVWNVRLTDHCSAPSGNPPGCSNTQNTATMLDTDWTIPVHALVPCSPSILPPAANCTLTTSANTLNPSMFIAASRSNMEADVRILDGGADGNPLTSGPPPDVPSVTFAEDGVFLP
jgi:hypothetical protein